MKKILLIFSFLITSIYSNDCGYSCPSGQSYVKGTPQYFSIHHTGYDVDGSRAYYEAQYSSTPDQCYSPSSYRDYYAESTVTSTVEPIKYDVKQWSAVYSCQPNPTCTFPEVWNNITNSCQIPPCDDNQTRNTTTNSCEDNPVCDANQTLDTSVSPPICSDIPCNDPKKKYSVEQERCVCQNGAPELYSSETSTWECQVPKCIPYDGVLPLYSENTSKSYCDTLINPVLKFTSTYYERDGLSCCYSDTVKSSDDSCPTNYIEDNNGVCQPFGNNEPVVDPDAPIPDPNAPLDPNSPPPPVDNTPNPPTGGGGGGSNDGNTTDSTGNCMPGFIWNNSTQKCLRFLPVQEGGFEGNMTGDGNGTDGNGTGGDSNGTNPDGSNGEGMIEIENDFKPNEGFFDSLFQDGNNKLANKASVELSRVENTFLSIHTINIPSPDGGGCGCVDEVINVTVKGHTFNKSIEACQYIQIFFETMKYLIWLLASYGLILKIREIV